ncbi:MAG: dihydropteroate synthase type 2 [Candidatus Azotimanducaceae bacterium]|jgi:dihydropteroate synthase type 2
MTETQKNQTPIIAGIVNITEDSFSDGGKFLSPDSALSRAHDVARQGARIVELGPASSHPDSARVPANIQIERLVPLIDAWPDRAQLSIDCTLPQVQSWAIKQSIGYLNDIRGFGDASMYPELAESDCQLIVMHAISDGELATRANISPNDIMGRLRRFFDGRLDTLVNAGISRSRIILDPGMGFFLGTNPETSLHVLRHTAKLKAEYQLPIMISVSRKSFLQKTAGVDVAHAGSATLSAELYAADAGADYLRTHDVQGLFSALKVWQALNPHR